MNLKEVVELLDLRVCAGGDALLDAKVRTAAASDLMSDVLARTDAPDILLTRLNNAQVVHTASVFGIKAVIIVRGRAVGDSVVEAAEEEDIVLLSSTGSLFESCGRLHACGLRSAG